MHFIAIQSRPSGSQGKAIAKTGEIRTRGKRPGGCLKKKQGDGIHHPPVDIVAYMHMPLPAASMAQQSAYCFVTPFTVTSIGFPNMIVALFT